ncbi:(2Fe-2S)-binding protein [Ornithinimicrobium avium]|uniref:Ferric siderophore reductase C-terminal domain-containing protein n=1 Tax=Ornithinimicrobium avium TaxID=2283195 RepID=A0A345NLA0_9MICO|nr:(2Fe-2S)-binding protein [Ornithinimicrobium avium]AXH95808.1 hypothetical protein DV701_06415 [Ornithinimicrobium avium]
MTPDADGGCGQVVADLAALGGFFVLAAPPSPGTDALPWADALADEALRARFATVRAALAASSGLPLDQVDLKVAVSATQVGLASRLWSVALAGAVLHGWLPDLSPANLLASPGHRGPVPLGVGRQGPGYAVPAVGGDAAAAASVVAGAVLPSLTLLADACARTGRTPRRVLTSNATSALVGGARVLAGLRPRQGPAAWALARALLDLPQVADGGARVAAASLPDGVGGAMEQADEAFLRSGCCVFYRLPGHGLCPDCVLAPSRAGEVTPGH